MAAHPAESLPEDGVGHTVDHPVDRCVQVSNVRDPQVDPGGQMISEVKADDDQVRDPTETKDDHNHEHHAAHDQCLLKPHPGFVTSAHLITEVQQVRLGPPDLAEDGSIAGQHHGQPQQHGHHDEESVGLVGRASPDALVGLGIEVVVTPSDEVTHLHGEGHEPDEDAEDANTSPGEDALVHVVVDDEHVTIDRQED